MFVRALCVPRVGCSVCVLLGYYKFNGRQGHQQKASHN